MVELEHETRGTGEPVVLLYADWFRPLLEEPALLPVPGRAAWGQAVAGPAMERYRAGDPAGAIDRWMRGWPARATAR
jgi:hypothetical protein